MKKLSTILGLTLLIISFAFCTAQAQQFNKKGTLELGGSISYSSTTLVSDGTTDSKSNSVFTFNPIASYFITDGFSLGVSPGINMIKIGSLDNTLTNLMLFAVPGYTFGKDKVFPFIEGWIGYTAVSTSKDISISSISTGSIAKLDLSGISYGGRGGVKLLVGKSGLINASLSYMMITANAKGASKRSGFNNFAIALGYTVFIGK
jgi:hypothetical protein